MRASESGRRCRAPRSGLAAAAGWVGGGGGRVDSVRGGGEASFLSEVGGVGMEREVFVR